MNAHKMVFTQGICREFGCDLCRGGHPEIEQQRSRERVHETHLSIRCSGRVGYYQ